MQSEATTPKQYIADLPEERKVIISKLRNLVMANLPQGFEEQMNYGMLGYVVPHKHYPAGYHCDTSLPLPFINIASQKAHIGFYHMGMYAKKDLLNWFVAEYAKTAIKVKLNMGKSCIRFKKEAHIPYELLGRLVSKMTVQDWVNTYESALKK